MRKWLEAIQHLSLKSIHHVSGVNEEHVLAFLASSQNSKDKFLNTMRLFCRYLSACKLVDRDIEYVIGSSNLTKREKIPSVYDPDEIKQIEDAVSQSGPVGKRDYAMLLLATRLGFRSSDIAGLQFANLDWDNNLIRLIQYKTKLEVELPLLADIARKLKPELIPDKISPHTLRHSYAMHLLKAGVNLVYIRDILGHVSIQTTEIYARADSKQKREALEAAYINVIPNLGTEGSWEKDSQLKVWLKNLTK
jgi:site-specific recombinase XerD